MYLNLPPGIANKVFAHIYLFSFEKHNTPLINKGLAGALIYKNYNQFSCLYVLTLFKNISKVPLTLPEYQLVP